MSYLTVLKMPSALRYVLKAHAASPVNRHAVEAGDKVLRAGNIGTHLCQKFHFLDGGIKERCYTFISL